MYTFHLSRRYLHAPTDKPETLFHASFQRCFAPKTTLSNNLVSFSGTISEQVWLNWIYCIYMISEMIGYTILGVVLKLEVELEVNNNWVYF